MLCPLSSVQRPASQWTPTGPDAKPQNPGPGTGLQGSSLQRPVQVGLAQLVVRHPLNHLDKRGPCIQLSRSSGRVIKSRRTRRPPRRPAKHNSRRIAPSHRPFPVASHKTRRCLEPTRLTRILSVIQPATLPQTDRTSPPTSSDDNVHVTTPEPPIDRTTELPDPRMMFRPHLAPGTTPPSSSPAPNPDNASPLPARRRRLR